MITTSLPGRFLIIQTAFIGDVILSTALLELVHQQYPEARVDILVRKGNEGLLANHPFVHEVLVWDKKKNKYRDLLRLLRYIRAQSYDVVINLQRFGATGLLTALSGARQTIGYDKNPFSRFFTHKGQHRIEPGIHEIDRNAALLVGRYDQRRVKPKLYPSEGDYAAVEPLQSRPYICIAPTSVWFTKQYPKEKWVDLIRHLPAMYTVYLLGAPTDTEACNWIQQAVKSPSTIINLSGKLTLLQSAALMEGAVMNYVNDSAPLHLCSAMNAPTTAIFCSTVPSFGFGPLADNSVIVETTVDLDCKPCGLHGYKKCPLGHFLCAHSIQTEQLRMKRDA